MKYFFSILTAAFCCMIFASCEKNLEKNSKQNATQQRVVPPNVAAAYYDLSMLFSAYQNRASYNLSRNYAVISANWLEIGRNLNNPVITFTPTYGVITFTEMTTSDCIVSFPSEQGSPGSNPNNVNTRSWDGIVRVYYQNYLVGNFPMQIWYKHIVTSAPGWYNYFFQSRTLELRLN